MTAAPTQCTYLYRKCGENTIGVGWATGKHPGSEGLAIELSLVQLGQTSKTVDVIIIHVVDINNQPMPDPMGGANNQKLSGDRMGIGLESDGVCYKVWLLVLPMVMCALEVGGDSTSQDPKNIDN